VLFHIILFSRWCGPCKLIKPTLCAWAEEWAGQVSFRKFEASKENAPIGKELNIKSVPTFIVYKDGEEKARVTGKQEEKLRALIVEQMQA
jgi:thioredoxin 1